jgi:ABC-type uncharacterized transport system substrate-binding protein
MVDKVGFLITTTPGDWRDYIKAFTAVWVDKLKHSANSIKKEPNGGAHGDEDDLTKGAQALEANDDVKVIVTAGTGAAEICKKELKKPFVYAAVGDPTLNHLLPGVDGTNFTGGNNRQADEAVVKARVKYMLDNGFQAPFVVLGNNENGKEPFQTAMTHAYNRLHELGYAVELQTITPANDIAEIIAALKAKNPPVKSIYVCSDPYLTVNSKLLNDEAHDISNGSPYINTMFEIKEHVDEHGGNAWFGSDFDQLFETAAEYAHEIMNQTATPAQLPNYIASLSGGGAAHIAKKRGKKGAKKKRKRNTKKK